MVICNPRLKDIPSVLKSSKSTYMYWQKRFDRENPNKMIKDITVEIRGKHKNFEYRRIYRGIIKLGFKINKKKVQRLTQKLCLQVKTYTRKSRKYLSYKWLVSKTEKNSVRRRFNTNIIH